METQRPWYKKKRYIISAIILGLILSYSGDTKTPTPIVQDNRVTYPTAQPVYAPAPIAPTRTTYPEPDLSNDNYYLNVSGNTVHSPAYSNSTPSNASAICGDGTYSFSQHRQGTCSHHGGVDEWF